MPTRLMGRLVVLSAALWTPREQPPDSERAGARNFFKYGKPVTESTLVYTNHAVVYDAARRVPRYVTERLTRDHVAGPANREKSKFKRDESVYEDFSAENRDYFKSGYSRGHMAAAGNNKFSQAAMDETFLLSNIVPQDLDNNAGFWNRLELYCRDLTHRYKEVYVISGPLYLAEAGEVRYPVLGDSQVHVPTHLFKVIVVEQSGWTTKQVLAAFVVPNSPIANSATAQDFQVDVTELERLAGVRFLPQLNLASAADLCQIEGCKLKTQAELDYIFLARRLESARTLERLEKEWQQVERRGLGGDPTLQRAYSSGKDRLVRKGEAK